MLPDHPGAEVADVIIAIPEAILHHIRRHAFAGLRRVEPHERTDQQEAISGVGPGLTGPQAFGDGVPLGHHPVRLAIVDETIEIKKPLVVQRLDEIRAVARLPDQR